MISIVIPVLNEEANISKLLDHLLANSLSQNISEIIVVDGGSLDKTNNIIQDFIAVHSIPKKEAHYYTKDITKNTIASFKQTKTTKIKLLNSEKGRAKQMNLGAKSATGDILYFLHADSFPPENFDTLILNQVNKSNQAGCFKMRFNSNHLWLKAAGWFTQFNWKSCRGGDQSLFVTTKLFNEIGGFNEAFVIYEDNDFISKLYAHKQFVVIQDWLTTSARRYKSNGIYKLQYHYCNIHIKKWLGASPKKLNDYYLKYIKC